MKFKVRKSEMRRLAMKKHLIISLLYLFAFGCGGLNNHLLKQVDLVYD